MTGAAVKLVGIVSPESVGKRVVEIEVFYGEFMTGDNGREIHVLGHRTAIFGERQ